MGCYGIGVSRVLAATVEVLSSESGIKWPWLIAPFKVCIVSPKVCVIIIDYMCNVQHLPLISEI